MERLLTPEEAAQLIRINTGRLYELLESGEIPAFRESSRWKIPPRLLEAYAESRAIEESKERRRLEDEKR